MTPLEKRAEEQTQNYTDSVQVIETDEIGNAVFRFKDIDQAFTSGFTSFKDQPEVKALLRALKGEHDGCNYLAYGTCNKCGSNVNSEALKAWGEFVGDSK